MKKLYKKGIISCSFVFFLIFNNVLGQNISRGPYLQVGTPTTMVIRYSTDIEQATKVKIGTDFNAKSFTSTDVTLDKNHKVKFENLKSNTKYYYSIGLDNGTEIGDTTFYFITSPAAGTVQKVKMVALGDCGTNTVEQTAVMSQVQNYFKSKKLDGILLLGDNAYDAGHDSEYQTHFFDKYKNTILQNTVLWPSPGNHDYGERLVWPNDWGTLPDYFKIFSMPIAGEAGGVPSYSQSYYSFNYSNIHFVSLDSYGSENAKRMSDLTSNQITWLKSDLAQNKQMWTVVFFHHPPYTKGSHNSDTEQELIDIRQNLVKVLEANNVNLVLNGHSHTYERSYPIHDFYGNSETFDAKINAASTSSGKYDGTNNSCPYVKKDKSIVYVVAGTAGWTGVTSTGYPHHAMYYSNPSDKGALVLEVDNNRFDVKYLSSFGTVLDNFTLFKNVNQIVNKTVECGEKFTANASWMCANTCGSSVGQIQQSFTIDSLTKSTQFGIFDNLGCLADTINVTVKPYPVAVATSNSPLLAGNTIVIHATFSGTNGVHTWTGPNSFTGTGLDVSIPKATTAMSGNYIITSKYKTCSSTATVPFSVTAPLATDLPNGGLKTYPNPFINTINLVFEVPEDGYYAISVLDNQGREIHKLTPKYYQIGEVKENIKLEENLSSSIYFLRIVGNQFNGSVKILK